MGLSKQCQPGCMSFDGGEVKHRRDCVHYPESLTKLWHDTEAELRAEIAMLRTALAFYAKDCAADTTYEMDCGYEGNMCCKTARKALGALDATND